MKKSLTFIALIPVILLLQSCPFLPLNQVWTSLDVTNTSNDSIYIYAALGISYAPTVYPDTLLPEDDYVGDLWFPHTSDSISGYLHPLGPQDTTCVDMGLLYLDDWEHGKYDKFLKDYPPITSFFFISADTLKKYGYDHVARHNMILARYDLTISDMKRLNLLIHFPPTEAMNGMNIRMPFSEK